MKKNEIIFLLKEWWLEIIFMMQTIFSEIKKIKKNVSALSVDTFFKNNYLPEKWQNLK